MTTFINTTKQLQNMNFNNVIEPFELRVGENDDLLICKKVLRLLPKKRIVALANWQNQEVIVKLFFSSKAFAHAKREEHGNRILTHAKINTPKILFQGVLQNDNNIRVLIFEKLLATIALGDIFADFFASKDNKEIVNLVVSTLAQEHEHGIYATDIHPDNFIYANNKIYVIDTASLHSQATPLKRKTCLKNLATLLAQTTHFDPKLCEKIYLNYINFRKWQPSQKNLQCMLHIYHEIIKVKEKKWLKKIFRTCTQFICKKTSHRKVICARKHYTDNMQALINNLDKSITNKTTIKAGNTCTVAKVTIDGSEYIIKRYNIKNFLHRLKRWFQTSRAEKSWKNAHQLLFYNVQTPTPIAIIEERFFFLKGRSYYITEFINGTPAKIFFAKTHFQKTYYEVAKKMVTVYKTLKSLNIQHGDMKADNFIVTKDKVYLIDLDSMKKYKNWIYLLLNKNNKDKKRFMLNWQTNKKIEKMFLELLN